MLYYVGEFTKDPRLCEIKHITRSLETEFLKDGDIIETWDHVFEWSEDGCVKASVLESWRFESDDLCDRALEETFSEGSDRPTGVDLLSAVQSQAAINPSGAAARFLKETSCGLPSDIAVNSEVLDAGADFFVTNSTGILQSLMHFGLAGGFASPRITKVLEQISYLVPPAPSKKALNQYTDTPTSLAKFNISETNNKRTYARLLETTQFVLEVMNCVVPHSASTIIGEKNRIPERKLHYLSPGGEGWKAILRVRLLHGIARRRILENVDRKGYRYDRSRDGIPINQEDLAATLGSFSAAPLWCLERLPHIRSPSKSERSAFIDLWRHIGFYLGVSPSILRNHFISPERSYKFLASTILHLLEFPSDPEGKEIMASAPTIPILLAISNRQPFPHTFERNCALTRLLIGDPLATHLSVPHTTPFEYTKLRFSLYKERLPQFFGEIYPRRGWEKKRRELVRIGMARVVRWQLGMRKTQFRPRSVETGELIYSDERGKKEEEIKMDIEGGRRLSREWRLLMIEMLSVLLGSAVLTTSSFYIVVRRMR